MKSKLHHPARRGALWVLGGSIFFASLSFAVDMVPIPAGEMRPFYRAAEDVNVRMPVAAFALDARPVSNADFLAFVQDQPHWRRSAVRRLQADEHYLAHWADDLALGNHAAAGDPVVNVSWFAARAFAAWAGKRLPTLAEWEYAAAANGVDGRTPAEVVLAWYAQPGGSRTSPATATGSNRFINALGIEDLHGRVWEWVEDFNSTLVGSDSRTREEVDRVRFCGAGALNAADRADYATFMRYAYRNSLKGRYTGRTLGFRCARDVATGTAAVAAPSPSNGGLER